MLTEVYWEVSISRARVFEWHKIFSEGRQNVEDDVAEFARNDS